MPGMPHDINTSGSILNLVHGRPMTIFLFFLFKTNFFSEMELRCITKSEFPEFITDAFTFTAWVNQGEDYLKEHYRWITRLIASYVKVGYFMFEDFLIDSPWIFHGYSITCDSFRACIKLWILQNFCV